MEEQAIPLINTMDTHNCANFLWGFSTLRYAPLQLLPPLASGMLDRGIATSAKPVEVADMAFALSSLASPGQYDDLLITLAGRASPDAALADFSSRQLVVLISALGQLEVVDKLPEGDFDAWIVAIKRAHAATPLQKRDAQTLEEVLKSLGIECGWVKSSEMLAAWTAMAADGQARKGREFTDEELRAAFDSIDTDGSGDIDEEELRAAIVSLDPSADGTMVDKMLSLADTDGDKEVSFDEFTKIMRTVFGRA